MVRICQMICENKHCILAVEYEESLMFTPVRMAEALIEKVTRAQAAGEMRKECGLCGNRNWHLEDMPTEFATLKDSKPAMDRLEQEQVSMLNALRGRPN